MLRDKPVFQEDMDAILNDRIVPWDELRGRTVFITGSTGLIGYALTSALLQYNLKRGGNIQVIALVRDGKKAEEKFTDWFATGGTQLSFLEGTVEDGPEIPGRVDYIIHCASPTASVYFMEHPVETIGTIYTGTKYVLELARGKAAQGVVFLSSMEVYGEIRTRQKLPETDLGYIDVTLPRSSYPEGKRLAETLCCAYAKEYGVPVTIARLAQTFGPGVDRSDGRVFAYMARCALAGENIRLNTDGSKENMYLYTMDGVSAILLLLVRGERGIAYNVANEETYCSIKEMAELVAKTLGRGAVGVEVNVGQGDIGKYRPDGYCRLDVSRLKELGWNAHTDLAEMYRRMAAAF